MTAKRHGPSKRPKNSGEDVKPKVGPSQTGPATALHRAELATDVTEQKHPEEALRESEEKYRLLFQNMAEGFAMYELLYDDQGQPVDWRVLQVNDAYARHTGIAPEQIVGRRISELFPAAIPEYLPRFAQVVASQTSVEFETYARAVGRHQRVVTFPAGQSRFASTIVDITDRKRAEDKAQRQAAVVAALARIFREALTCKTEEELYRVCLAAAEEVTQSNFGFLGEINGQTGKLDDVILSDPVWDACRVQHPSGHGKMVPAGFAVHGVYGRVLLDGKGFFTNDLPSHPDSIGMPPGHPPLTAFLGVPLVHAGATIGMVGLGNRDGGYGPEQLEAAEALAPVIVQAIMSKRAEKALQQSERRFRALTEKAGEYITIADATGTITYENPTEKRTLGFAAEDLVGRNVFELVHPQDQLETRRLFNEVVRQPGHSAEVELRVRTRNGSWRWLYIVGSNLLDDPAVRGIVLNSRDITERKRIEEALRESEARLRAALENAPFEFWVRDLEGRCIMQNAAAVKHWGERIGKRVEESNVPEDVAAVWQANNRRALAGEVVVGEVVYVCNGERRVYHNVIAPFRVNGDIRGVLGFNIDITERKRAEEALRNAAQQWQTTFDAVGEAVFLLDAEQRICRSNKAAQALVAKSEAEMEGRFCHEIVHGTATPIPECPARRLCNSLRREALDLVMDDRCFNVTADPVFDAKGNLTSVVHIIHDVTERKRAEDAEFQEHLLTTAEDIQRRIAQDLHDDVGQELTGLGLKAETLAETLASTKSPARKLAADMATAVDRTRGKVRGLSRGLLPVELEEGLLAVAMGQLVDATTAGSRIVCKFDCSHSDPVFDRRISMHLYRIAQEAVSNAVRHGRARSIRITLDQEDGETALKIEDDGEGLWSEASQTGGMGLRTMQYRAELIGGKLEIGPGPSGGTQVICRLSPPHKCGP
jgi:PAS domain S-box-containing protein